jgi:hypothetical protein
MKCQENDPKPRAAADAIAATLGGARDRAAAARAAVTRAHDKGLTVVGAKFSLDQISTSEQKLRATVHTLDSSRVEAGVAEIDRAITETLRLVTEAEHERKVEVGDYYLALAFAAILLATLALKVRQLDKRRRTGGS